MKTTVLIYYDERMLGHQPTGWDIEHPEWSEAVKSMIAHQYPEASLATYDHPERPERLTAIVERLQVEPVVGQCWELPRRSAVQSSSESIPSTTWPLSTR